MASRKFIFASLQIRTNVAEDPARIHRQRDLRFRGVGAYADKFVDKFGVPPAPQQGTVSAPFPTGLRIRFKNKK